MATNASIRRRETKLANLLLTCGCDEISKAYIREQAEFLYKPRHNLLGFFDNINSETAGSKNGL